MSANKTVRWNKDKLLLALTASDMSMSRLPVKDKLYTVVQHPVCALNIHWIDLPGKRSRATKRTAFIRTSKNLMKHVIAVLPDEEVLYSALSNFMFPERAKILVFIQLGYGGNIVIRELMKGTEYEKTPSIPFQINGKTSVAVVADNLNQAVEIFKDNLPKLLTEFAEVVGTGSEPCIETKVQSFTFSCGSSGSWSKTKDKVMREIVLLGQVQEYGILVEEEDNVKMSFRIRTQMSESSMARLMEDELPQFSRNTEEEVKQGQGVAPYWYVNAEEQKD